MLIQKKTFSFSITGLGAPVASWVFYKKADNPTVPFTYMDPHIVVPVETGKLTYNLIIPDQIPLEEGMYQLGVASFDAEGNGSDIVTLTRFFDFTAPDAPFDLKVT
jgi:hypothetical protein